LGKKADAKDNSDGSTMDETDDTRSKCRLFKVVDKHEIVVVA